MSTGRNTAQRNRDRARLAASKPNCSLCGEPINYELKWPDPRCFVADHTKPWAKGGEDNIRNKTAVHNECNSKKRARTVSPIIRRSGTLE